MKPTEAISNETLTGAPITPDEREKLLGSLVGLVPAWLLDLCTERNLAGSVFSLDDESDLSGMGVELKWMTVEQMIDEATNAYPGIAATKKGYLPFGICLEGSGDPYFLNIGKGHDDTSVVRIPHGAVTEEEIDESRIEIVATNLVDFFGKSEPG